MIIQEIIGLGRGLNGLKRERRLVEVEAIGKIVSRAFA
jgi:hypothetical protein